MAVIIPDKNYQICKALLSLGSPSYNGDVSGESLLTVNVKLEAFDEEQKLAVSRSPAPSRRNDIQSSGIGKQK
jgi:hypothetical protein